MLYVYQNISSHMLHEEDTKLTEWSSDLSYWGAVMLTHMHTSLFPSQDSGLSSVPLPCVWNKVVFGEEGVFPNLTEVCLGLVWFGLVLICCLQWASDYVLL